MSTTKVPSTETSPGTSCTPAPPPTAAEIQRKLSCHAPTPPAHRRKGSQSKSPSALSGTESDSDASATFSPPTRHINLDAATAGPASQPAASSAAPVQPLAAIAEKDKEGSGDDTDDEDDEWAAAADQGQEALECENVVKAGYLQKKGERRKTWKKRWFVLRQTQLSYYKSSKEYQTLRVMSVAEIHSVSPVTLKRHDYTFGIVTPSRTYYVQAGSGAEVESWVRAITDAKTKLAANSASTAATETAETKTKHVPPAINLQRTGSEAVDIQGRRTPPPSHQHTQMSASPSSPGYSHNYPITSSDSEDHDQEDAIITPTGSPNIGAVGTSPGAERQTIQFAAPDRDPKKVILQGYLMKCGHQRKKWKKRWLVLTPERLIYAKSHLELGNVAKPGRNVKVIPLDRILDAIECSVSKKEGHGLGLVGGGIERSTSITGSISMPSSTSNGLAPISHPVASQGASPLAHAATVSGGDMAPQLPHTFKIITPKKPLVLCAPSEEEEIKWMSAVRALIARRTGNNSTHPSSATEHAATIGPGVGASILQQSQSQQNGGSPSKRMSRRQGSESFVSSSNAEYSFVGSPSTQQIMMPKSARKDSISKALSAVTAVS